MGFAQLHCHHSSGSMLDSVVTSEQLAQRATQYGHKSLAVTDHGRLSAWFEHQQACRKYGINPVFGLEQYVIPDDELVTLNDKGKRVRCKNNHLILLAKSDEGMNNIRHLHYISMTGENHFYYNNHSTFSEIFQYKKDVICGTACMMSPFSNALKEGNPEKSERLFNLFLDNFRDDFYVEVQLNELVHEGEGLEHGQKTVNDFLISLADKHGVPVVITGDVHYLDKEDYRLQDISLAMRERRTVNDPGFTLEARTLFYHDVCDYKFLNERFGYGYTDAQIEQWCDNAGEIASRCHGEIPERTTMIFPAVTTDDEYEMERLVKENLARKFGVDEWQKAPQEYVERVEYELDLLKRKGFGSYCMVLQDIFRFCDEEEIPVGFGRGSGAGSLVLYLLGITRLDPIKYGLLFERFVSEARCVNTVVDYFS